MKNRQDGWITDKGKFLQEEFNHKDTLSRNGFDLDCSDAAIRAGFTRLVDEGNVLYAEVWHTYYPTAKDWLEKHATDRDIELTVFNQCGAARVFRINGRL